MGDRERRDPLPARPVEKRDKVPAIGAPRVLGEVANPAEMGQEAVDRVLEHALLGRAALGLGGHPRRSPAATTSPGRAAR